MKENKKVKKDKFVDDGRTIANMNVDGFKWYVSDKDKKKQTEIREMKLTRRERWAMIKAAYLTVIPLILLYITGFALIFLLLTMWLR